MKKFLVIAMIVIIAVAAGVFVYMKINNIEIAGELKTFTVTGEKDQVSYRNYTTNKNYTAFTEEEMDFPSYTWVKTADSEAILDFNDFGKALLDKNSLVQVQIDERGVYIIHLKGNCFHAVNDLTDSQVYNVETLKGVVAVSGTGFGTEGQGGTWTEDGETIVIDYVDEDHSNMDEEDVPDGPLIVLGGRTVIVRNPGRRWIPSNDPGDGGNRVGPGEEANYGNNGRAAEVRPITGSNWRERARDFYNRLRDLERQRRTIGDAAYRDGLRALLNAYNATLPADIQISDGQNLDCDNIRNFVIPHAMPAIEKLKSSEDMESTASLIFLDLGGLTGVEDFLNTVCDDNTVDAGEKAYLEKFNEVFSQ